MTRQILCSAAALLLTVTSAFSGTTFAALAPSTVERMKKEATDVVRIDVLRVDTRWEGFTKLGLTIHAQVTGVERSTSGVKQGDTIEIDSYHLLGPIRAPGPQNPPRIKKPWKGTVWLKSTEAPGKYGIAVFGHSFAEEKDEPAVTTPE